MLQEARSVSAITKFFLIFGRNILFLRRNPKITLAIFINSIYFGLVLVAVFFHVGQRTMFRNSKGELEGGMPSVSVWVGNWVGVA